MNRDYGDAIAQVAERIAEAVGLLGKATGQLADLRPTAAAESLHAAQARIDGAKTICRWAATLPQDNNEDA